LLPRESNHASHATSNAAITKPSFAAIAEAFTELSEKLLREDSDGGAFKPIIHF
jgi:hypothetical protein